MPLTDSLVTMMGGGGEIVILTESLSPHLCNCRDKLVVKEPVGLHVDSSQRLSFLTQDVLDTLHQCTSMGNDKACVPLPFEVFEGFVLEPTKMHCSRSSQLRLGIFGFDTQCESS